MFCNLYFVKIHKITNYSTTTTKAREKTDLECVFLLSIPNVCLVRLWFNLIYLLFILLDTLGHRFIRPPSYFGLSSKVMKIFFSKLTGWGQDSLNKYDRYAAKLDELVGMGIFCNKDNLNRKITTLSMPSPQLS